MKSRIQEWGNGLALRIPKSFAVELELHKGSMVEVSVAGGRLVITPVSRPKVTLRHLLAGVTKQNLQHEVDTGISTGNEAW